MNFIELINKVAVTIGRTDLTSNALIAEGTSANTLKITNTIYYDIWGTRYSKAAADNIAMTACAAQAATTYCFYLVSVDSSGSVTVTKGTESTSDDCVLPACPSAQVAIGAFKIYTAAATTFTSGTDDLSKTGVTDTYYDMDCLYVADFIRSAIKKLERQYNFRHMKVNITGSLASAGYTVAATVTDYKRLIAAFCLNATTGYRWELEKTSIRKALNAYPDYTDDTGPPKFICEVPTAETDLTPDISPTPIWLFRPTADQAYTIELWAYQYTPVLDGARYTTNWWTQNAWEVILYGACLEAETFLINDSRIGLWKALYEEAVKKLIETEIDEEFMGSPQEVISDYTV